jgi:hypothetical protein
VATLSGDCHKWIIEKNARYWVKNAPDLLDEPEEWYLDKKTGVLSYLPLPGEDPSQILAIAPAMKQIVRIEGARNLRFEGITFSHADWSIGPKGYSDSQAAIDYPGAVWAQGAVDYSFEDCTFSHVGGYGLDFSKGCRENRVVRCEVTDIGAGGIRIALLIAEVGPGVRRPGVVRVLEERPVDLWARGIPLSILRERHAMMGREPPIIAVARGKSVEQV